MERNLQQEILERIVRIETKLDGYTATKEKIEKAYSMAHNNTKAIDSINDNLKWLWRTFAGAILLGILSAAIKFN